MSTFNRPAASTEPPAHQFVLATQTSQDDDAASINSRHTLKTLSGYHTYHDDDDDQVQDADPWRTLPSNFPPAPGLMPADTPLDPVERRRLLLRAALQLLALFLVCLLGLGGTLWLALPVIDEADQPAFRIPKSFDQLKQLNTVLQHYKSEHFARVMLCWVIVYMFLQAFSIPGSMYMSILAGALWGVPIALPLVCASVATGATICYLISKFLGVVLVALPSWRARIDDWKDKLATHNDDMLSYLIIIRMMPLPPHNVVNILAPHLGISIPLFWASTFFGIFAVSVIHTTIGEKLDQMASPDDFHLFSLRNVLLLGGVCIAVLIPVAVRKFSKVEALEEQQDTTTRGAVYLPDDEDQLPSMFSHRSLVGRTRASDDEDDELPPVNGIRVDANDDDFTAWRDTVHGSRIGEDDFLSDDESPMFPDRHSHPASAASLSDRVKSWWTSRSRA